MTPLWTNIRSTRRKEFYLLPFLLALFSMGIAAQAADDVCSSCQHLAKLNDEIRELLDLNQSELMSLQNLTPAELGNLLDLSGKDQPSLQNLSQINMTGLLDQNQSDMEYPLMLLELELFLLEQEAEKSLDRVQLPPELQALPPGDYSLLDHLTYIPEERDQRGGCLDHCGNCWVWANTGALELDMAYKKNIRDRLSIQFFNSNYHNATGIWACCGGTSPWFADFYSRKGRAVPWSNANASFKDGCSQCQDFSTIVPASTIAGEPHYDLESISALVVPTHQSEDGILMGNERAIDNIKGTLRSNKGVIFLYALDDWDPFMEFWSDMPEEVFWTPTLGRSYSDGNSPGAHATLCVGYNDTDPLNRYWVVLNSWGAPANRPHGLFRVSMDLNYSYQYEEGLYAYSWYALDVKYPQHTTA